MWKKLSVLFIIGYVQAMTDEEIKSELIKAVMKCTKDHPVEISELLSLQKYIVPTDKKLQCLLACTYRSSNVMNDKGEFDLAANYEIAEATKGHDPKSLANARKLADICVKVNEVKVKDDTKGCERAALIFKCLIENAPKLGFKI